ncbi:MAG: hemin uptake protein HemP [Gammaproteobacteria bacterium]|nr:hemin uptake protein HemP [Gammaproteobacteria bacterium]
MVKEEEPSPIAQRSFAEQRVYPSITLFQGEKSIIIEHQNEHYFLRITKSNKLILTK